MALVDIISGVHCWDLRVATVDLDVRGIRSRCIMLDYSSTTRLPKVPPTALDTFPSLLTTVGT